MKKTKLENPVTIPIKVGACLTGPTKRMIADFAQVGIECNRARNAVADHWREWHRKHPRYKCKQRTDRDGNPKVNQKGEPVMENPGMPQQLDRALYKPVATSAVPTIAAQIVSACAAQVKDFLLGKTPWNHPAKKQHARRYQAILDHQMRLPEYTSVAIPIPSQISAIGHEGRVTPGKSPGLTKMLADTSKSSAVFGFAMHSQKSGRKNRWRNAWVVFRIHVAGLPRGHRRMIRQLATGDLPLGESKLINDDGQWFLRLVLDARTTPTMLDDASSLTLIPSPADAARPFQITTDGIARWFGFTDWLEERVHHYESRRQRVRRQTRDKPLGHGQGRLYAKIRPWSRRIEDIKDSWVKQRARDLAKLCIRHGCGTLVYREPSLPLRDLLWFSKHGVQFDWTQWLTALRQVCLKNGIKLVEQQVGVKEWKAQFGIKSKREQAFTTDRVRAVTV